MGDKKATQKPYRSYMLRLWAVKQPQGESWHASLEDPHSGERMGFACLEELFAYLIDQVTANNSCAKEETEQ